jgi:hypothetical protein
MADKPTYPLINLEIGSTVLRTPGKFGTSVIRGNVTRTIPQSQEWTTMRGRSRYVHSEEMNQHAFGISGSYGFSGLSKASVTLSGHLGWSNAEASKSDRVYFQKMVCGGLQYVSFDDLTPAELMTALAAGPQKMLSKALDAYTALNEALKANPGLNDRSPRLLQMLAQPAAFEPEYQKFKVWLRAVEQFKADDAYGEGVVVAVAWGGVGVVTMELKSRSSDSTTKYGGEAEFSYASVASSVTGRYLYNHSGASGDASVDFDIDGFSVGSCVAEVTNKWIDELKKTAMDKLANTSILSKAPEMKELAKVKDPPAFMPKKADKSLTSKIEKIDSTDALKAFALASAYEKQKQDDPKYNKSLADFLKETEKNVDVKPLENLQGRIEKNDVQVVPAVLRSPVAADAARSIVSGNAPLAEPAAPPASTGDDSGFTKNFAPLAIWIARWDHLFPWLADGILNSISDLSGAEPVLRYRVMFHDFLTLGRLYYVAASCDFKLDALPSATDCKQIGDAFLGACATLEKNAGDYQKSIKDAFASLSPNARSIYQRWEEIGFLRGAELGLGVIEQPIIINGAKHRPADGCGSPLVSPNGQLRRIDEGHYVAQRQKCDFVPGGSYAVFADFYKLLPLIHPQTKRIYAFGPSGGVLARVFGYQSGKLIPSHPKGFLFINRNLKENQLMSLMTFVPDKTERVLYDVPDDQKVWNGQPLGQEHARSLKLYPIPFVNVPGWKGLAFSTNVASMTELKDQLQEVKNQINFGKYAWSFTPDAIPGWTGDAPYRMKAVPKQFLGIIDQEVGKIL